MAGDVADTDVVVEYELKAGLGGGLRTHFNEPVEAAKEYNCFALEQIYNVPRAPIVI